MILLLKPSILSSYRNTHKMVAQIDQSIICFFVSPATTYLLLRAAVGGIKAVGVILLGGGGALTRPGGLSMHRPGGHVPHPQGYCLDLLVLN